MNNKGNMVIGIVLLIVVVFTAGLTGLFMNNIVDEINTEIQTDNSFNNESKQIMSGVEETYNPTVDYIIGLILVLSWLFILVLAWNGNEHPMLYILLIVILIILAIVGAVLSNAWEDVTTEDEFSSAPANFPITNYLLTNFLVVIVLIGFSAFIIMFIKRRYN